MKILALSSCWLSLATLATAQHVGPVTGIEIIDEEVYSCSQAGVFRGTDLMARPNFRVFAMTKWDAALLVVGGSPGESGAFTIIGRDAESAKLGDDVIYDVARHGQTMFLAMADGRILEATLGEGATERARHTAAARSVRVSGDGKVVASGGLDRVVILSRAGARPISIQDHTERVDCVVFSPDSTQIASGARDGKVRIHASADGRLVRTYSGLLGEVSAIAWAEQLLAGTSAGRVYRLNLENDTAELIAELGADSPVTALALDSKGGWLAGTLHRIHTP